MEPFQVLAGVWILIGVIAVAMADNSGVLVVEEGGTSIFSREGCREVLTCLGHHENLRWIKRGLFADEMGSREEVSF